MIQELKEKLELLATLLEHDLKGKEELLKNANEHYQHYATAAMTWEQERVQAEKEHETNKENAKKAQELLDSLLKK
jgi:ribosomal protein L12E/L44/L45/RPP1/RPP2